jgi:hypothetical protein
MRGLSIELVPAHCRFAKRHVGNSCIQSLMIQGVHEFPDKDMAPPDRSQGDRFLAWLSQATALIGPEYVSVSTAGSETPRMRERVYSYELYHQLRCIAGDSGPLRVMGELDKRGHATISAAVAPDLVCHTPGAMTDNALVVEIKSAYAPISGVRKDLGNLTFFRSEAHYGRAILLVYGPTARVARIQAVARAYARDGYGRPIDIALIELWWHGTVGERARHLSWIS